MIYERQANEYVRKVLVEQNQQHAKVVFENEAVFFLTRTGNMPTVVSHSDMKFQSMKPEVLRGPDSLPPLSQFEHFVTQCDMNTLSLAVKVVYSQRQQTELLTYVAVSSLD